MLDFLIKIAIVLYSIWIKWSQKNSVKHVCKNDSCRDINDNHFKMWSVLLHTFILKQAKCWPRDCHFSIFPHVSFYQQVMDLCISNYHLVFYTWSSVMNLVRRSNLYNCILQVYLFVCMFSWLHKGQDQKSNVWQKLKSRPSHPYRMNVDPLSGTSTCNILYLYYCVIQNWKCSPLLSFWMYLKTVN